jgi:hypothetical protein
VLHKAQQPGVIQLPALGALGGRLGEAVVDGLQAVCMWRLQQRVLEGDGRALAILVPHLGKEKK